MIRKIIATILCITMIIGMMPMSSIATGANANLAIGKTASSSSDEAASVAATKAIDGNANTRWACTVGNKPAWLKVDLGSSMTVGGVSVNFYRKNASAFTIDTSTNGTTWTTQKTYAAFILNKNLIANFTTPISARYVRVHITEYSASEDTGPDGGNSWNAVSIAELGIYAGKVPINASTVLSSLSFTQPSDNADSITIPTLSAENAAIFDVVFNGADYEQLIGQNREIFRPIVDSEAIINFKVVDKLDKTNYALTPDIRVPLKGTMTGAGTNSKPKVIPELREWFAGTGNVTLDATSKIVVDSAVTGEKATALLNKANIFKDDYKSITGRTITVVTATSGTAKDFFMTTVTTDKGLGDEGYRVTTADTGIKLEAATPTGAFWATRTVLQILAQDATKSNLPKGTVRDYPRFKVRGFMYDVARHAVSIKGVDDVAKAMSWYKMNDLQLHLNDTSFEKDWPPIYNAKFPANDNTSKYNKLAFVLQNMKSGFRIESNIKGPGGAIQGNNGQSSIILPPRPLHSAEEYYYTKDEFRNFTKNSNEYGVKIVPEFDTPAHATSFIKAFPALRYKKMGRQVYNESTKTWTGGTDFDYDIESVAMLDATNPEVKRLITSVYEEYIKTPNGGTANGKDEVFINDIVHIGADEFYGNGDEYREYTDFGLGLIQQLGKTPRIWGSLTEKKGTIPVRADGVQLNFWYEPHSNPKDMYEMGYDMINIEDRLTYMVPSGKEDRRGYGDRIMTTQFKSFIPNKYGRYTIPAGDKQALGAAFALWQDNTDLRASGLTEFDFFDRIREGLIIFSEQTWSMPTTSDKADWNELNNLSKTIGSAPNTNPYVELKSNGNTIMDYNFDDSNTLKDTSTNNYDATSLNNAVVVAGQTNKGIALIGGNSSVELPAGRLAPKYTATMWVNRSSDGGNSEQVLLENRSRIDNPDEFTMFIDQFKAVQKKTGKVGFSREGYDYSFDYTLPTNQWVKLALVAEIEKTTLYVNDKLIGDAILDRGEFRNPTIPLIDNSTFILPLDRIGSKKNSFVGLIDGLKVEREKTFTPIAADSPITVIPDAAENVDKTTMTVKAVDANDATINNFSSELIKTIDGDATLDNTKWWHSNWDLSMPMSLVYSFKNPNLIDKLSYTVWVGNDKVIKDYEILVKNGTGAWKSVLTGTFANVSNSTVNFTPTLATDLKLIIKSSYKGNSDACINEITIGVKTDATIARNALRELYEQNLCKIGAIDSYTSTTFEAFLADMNLAKRMIDDERLGSTQLNNMCTKLQTTITALALKADSAAVPVVKEQLPSLLLSYKNEETVLSVEASGTNIGYKWYKNGVLLPGEIGKSITVSGVTATYTVKTFNIDVGKTESTYTQSVTVVSDILRGDVNTNNVVDIEDALLALKIITGVKTDATNTQLKAYNMAKETTVSSLSVDKILQELLK